jgi:hypothetical protein
LPSHPTFRAICTANHRQPINSCNPAMRLKYFNNHGPPSMRTRLRNRQRNPTSSRDSTCVAYQSLLPSPSQRHIRSKPPPSSVSGNSAIPGTAGTLASKLMSYYDHDETCYKALSQVYLLWVDEGDLYELLTEDVAFRILFYLDSTAPDKSRCQPAQPAGLESSDSLRTIAYYDVQCCSTW